VKKPLIILTGPTAVGKTSLSIALAKAVNGEIISADSMQVYRHMDIGSAKIRPEEMQGVPHHLVDCLEPDEEFNVVRFQQMAKEAMKGIYDRGRIPVLVGGTGFYIQAVTGDIDFTCTWRGYDLSADAGRKRQRPRVRRCFMRCLPLWIPHPRKRFMRTMSNG
jgi:tRNA dimethylallyltransferase